MSSYPENPVVCRVWRGGAVESVHRGAWVVVDGAGNVLEGAGEWGEEFYPRSAVKSLQALPLLETGASERFGFTDEELCLALSSHNGEPCHTEGVAGVLERIGLGGDDLRCGPQVPLDVPTRVELNRRGERPTALHNNCSGKHAGFLALSLHLGEATEHYLDPSTEAQSLVRQAMADMTGVDAQVLVPGIDGCSAPTYRFPLQRLATAFARVTNPEGLASERAAHCRRMTDAVGRNPVLIAGSRKRFCTDLARASGGRLFPKVGAEAVYAVGEVGGGRALAVKVDDGADRALYPLVAGLLRKLGFLRAGEEDALASWYDPVLKNRAGLEVGHVEPILA